MLTRAFLGAVEIIPVNGRPPKNQVNVRVVQMFRTRSSVYVHYMIENNSKRAYHVAGPGAYQLQVTHPSIALPSLMLRQLDEELLRKLRDTHEISLPIAHAEAQVQDLRPGEATRGVVAIRKDFNSPAVVELVFDGGVKATFVL